MKKLKIIIFCVMLLGCQPKDIKTETVPLSWEGIYSCRNIELNIKLEDDYLDGFYYSFEYNGKSVENYADYQDENSAVSAPVEDGYSVKFFLKKDKVIIEESDAMSYLQTQLSGEYDKE